jgi:hypothetical protein
VTTKNYREQFETEEKPQKHLVWDFVPEFRSCNSTLEHPFSVSMEQYGWLSIKSLQACFDNKTGGIA